MAFARATVRQGESLIRPQVERFKSAIEGTDYSPLYELLRQVPPATDACAGILSSDSGLYYKRFSESTL